MHWWCSGHVGQYYMLSTINCWTLHSGSNCDIPSIEPYPDSKALGANMGPTRGRQDPREPHVGPMNFDIWVYILSSDIASYNTICPIAFMYFSMLVICLKTISLTPMQWHRCPNHKRTATYLVCMAWILHRWYAITPRQSFSVSYKHIKPCGLKTYQYAMT